MSLSTTTSTLTGALDALCVSLPAVVLPLPLSCPLESNVVGGSAVSQSSKPAWSRPSNPVESSPPVLVTDSSSWPTLTESARRTNSEEGTMFVSSTMPMPNTNNNPNPNSTPKSTKPGGGGTHTVSIPVSLAMPIIHPSGMQPSPRAKGNNNHKCAYNGSDNSRGGGGGVMPHHCSFGSRWDLNSRNYVMYPQHNFGFSGWEVREPPLQHHGPPPPFHGLLMPPPVPPDQHRSHRLPFQWPSTPPPSTSAVPFTVQPPYVPPYMNPVEFQGIPPPLLLPHLPIISHPHAMPPPVFIPGTDAHRAELLRQVHFYFSYQNLCKDVYLRQYMDENGWVPISLIAGFNCVKRLTNDIKYILDVLQTSTIVEVQGDKIRLRNNWKFWILPSTLNKTRSPD